AGRREGRIPLSCATSARTAVLRLTASVTPLRTSKVDWLAALSLAGAGGVWLAASDSGRPRCGPGTWQRRPRSGPPGLVPRAGRPAEGGCVSKSLSPRSGRQGGVVFAGSWPAAALRRYVPRAAGDTVLHRVIHEDLKPFLATAAARTDGIGLLHRADDQYRTRYSSHPSLRRLPQRKFDPETHAAARDSVGNNPAAMRLHRPLRDRQAKPRAMGLGREKGLEQPAERVVGNPRPAVGHADG